ncbi:hypothetical protein HED60_00965 [Planctomycetales bacterium ZRK34]|nr:hypothetical protein HED60_00965 [Planctomycetales bacterium ZRK34]
MKTSTIIVLLLATCFCLGADTVDSADWRDRLFVPTYLVKLNGRYFIVDCWQHRVIYNDQLTTDLSKWETLDDTLGGPHSIDSDGEYLIAENTGYSGVRLYKPTDDGEYEMVDEVSGLGKRTHRTRYDPDTGCWYVISANTQDITKLKRDGDKLHVVYTKNLKFLGGKYTRSMTIMDGFMYFMSGPGVITKTRYKDGSFEVLATYKTPDDMKATNDILRTDEGWYYLDSTPGRMVRFRSFEDLDTGKYENVYGALGLKGSPYYMRKIDGRYYVPQIYPYCGIISFVHDKDGNITDVQKLFDFGKPSEQSRKRVTEFKR